jgi:hypothetical protein
MLLINTTPTPTPAPDDLKILSIDVWGNKKDGYEWNEWHCIGYIKRDAVNWTPRRLLKHFREWEYLTSASAGRCCIDDDGYNIIIIERATQRPLYAIEYGSAIL